MNKLIIINQSRELSWIVWEKTISWLLWCKKHSKRKWADLYLDDKTDVEVKCRLYGQPINILIDQLLGLRDNDIYALLYYKLYNGLRPTSALKQKPINTDSLEYFQSIIFISKIFLFPAWYIKDFYENTHMKESTISSSWRKHKWLSVNSALKIFNDSKDEKKALNTPLCIPNSPEAVTYVIWEKIQNILFKNYF